MSQENVSPSAPSLSVYDVLSVFWSKKFLIAKITGSITLLSVVISLMLPNYYKSTATLLPGNTNNLGRFSGISELASLAGVNVGGGDDQEKLYPLIVMSESVLKNVIYSQYHSKYSDTLVNLIKFWDIEGDSPEIEFEITLKKLREEMNVSLDVRANTISISIETKEPRVSAEIVNNVLAELDTFMKTKKTTNASEQRLWISSRLKEVESDLQKSENTLKDFRERNRVIGTSPELLLMQERMIREVQINQTIYIELKKQYEIARIEEIKNAPIINVLDSARPAAKKERPKRALIVLFSFTLGLLGSLSYVTVTFFYKDVINKLRGIFAV
ncbi:MAG: GNVR domain-containing protein [Bacteroidota bacterium]